MGIAAHLKNLVAVYIVLVVIYGNVVIMAYESPLHLKLPDTIGYLDLFNVFAVFSYYEKENMAVALKGHVSQNAACPQANHWVGLNPDNYFPHFRGEQESRAWASRQYVAGGKGFQKEAWSILTRKITQHYNRAHPQCILDTLELGNVRWPRSQAGYFSNKHPKTETYYPWFNTHFKEDV